MFSKNMMNMLLWLWKSDFGTIWHLPITPICKIQWFHLTTVDFWPKTFLILYPSQENFTTGIAIIWDLRERLYSPKFRGWEMASLIAISGLLVQSTLTPSSANSLNFAESSLIQGTPGNQAIQITPFSWAFEASSDFIVSAQRLTESPGRSLSKKFSGVGFRNVIPFSSFRMPVINIVPLLVSRYC